MAYSCDTEPCDEVIRLSEGVDVLIHEATGESLGHSSARQAGEIAKKLKLAGCTLFIIQQVNLQKATLLPRRTPHSQVSDAGKGFYDAGVLVKNPLSKMEEG